MIPLMRNAFHEEQITRQRLSEAILSMDKFSMGSHCRDFEEKFARWQGSAHCVLMSSGSSANLALIQAAINIGMIRKPARIGISAVTWATNVMPLVQLGITPVPIDCSPDTLNVTADGVTSSILRDGLNGLFITNALGFCDDIESIAIACDLAGIPLLEDNCESLGASAKGKNLGSFGMAGTFSFFVGHHMSTIEGGCVCTDNGLLCEELLRVRSNGWNRNIAGAPGGFYESYMFHSLGFNLRPTEITGWLGKDQLRYLDSNIRRRREIFDTLKMCITGDKRWRTVDAPGMDCSPMAFPIVCATPELRRELVARFTESQIEVRPIIGGNITRQPFYKSLGLPQRELPGADTIHYCGLYCGLFPDMTPDDIGQIVECLQ